MFDIISLFAAELEDRKIGMWGKGLKGLFLSKHQQGFSAQVSYV